MGHRITDVFRTVGRLNAAQKTQLIDSGIASNLTLFHITIDCFALHCTSIGVLTADNDVNPQMSLKYIVTLSNFSASTIFPDISMFATDLTHTSLGFI